MLREDITILFSMISSSSSVISCLFSDSVLRRGGDFRRIPVKVEAVSRIVDDSGAVLLRKDTFAHGPVTVCGARLQARTISSATIGIWRVSAITASTCRMVSRSLSELSSLRRVWNTLSARTLRQWISTRQWRSGRTYGRGGELPLRKTLEVTFYLLILIRGPERFILRFRYDNVMIINVL